MSTKKASKSRAKARKVADPADAAPEKFPEQTEIFEQSPRNARLENKAKLIANRRDRIKTLKDEEKGYVAEALIIMHDHEITNYSRHGVVLRIKTDEKLDVAVDSASSDDDVD